MKHITCAAGPTLALALWSVSTPSALCYFNPDSCNKPAVPAAAGIVETASRLQGGTHGEQLPTTGPIPKANPLRPSTRCQEDKTDSFYYGYRYYNPSTGRWLSRDPIGKQGGRNDYALSGNSSQPDVLGLCKVCSSGIHWRVDIAGLDSFQKGTPYQDLADAIQGVLSKRRARQGISFPRFTKTGPGVAFNQERGTVGGGLEFPPGGIFATYYLFFADFDIDETDGPCTLWLFETSSGVDVYSNGKRFQLPPAPQNTSPDMKRKSDRKTPVACCSKTLIYADSPDAIGLKEVPGITGFGPQITVSSSLRVLDDKGKIVSALQYKVELDADWNGTLTTVSP